MSELHEDLEAGDAWWWPSDDEDYHSEESDDFFHYDDGFDAGDSSDNDVNVIDDGPEPSVCTRSKLRELFNLLEIPQPEMIENISNRGDLSQKRDILYKIDISVLCMQ